VSEALRIVALGGTTRLGSASETALRYAAAAAERLGAEVQVFAGPALDLPMFDPARSERGEPERRLTQALAHADGVIVASPGYHGSFSGLVKNALDYAEDLRGDARPYLDGRAVGLIACAAGWQATAATLAGLRSVAHALRAWPTPLGVAVNTAGAAFDEAGAPSDPAVAAQLTLLAGQVVAFARAWRARDAAEEAA